VKDWTVKRANIYAKVVGQFRAAVSGEINADMRV